MNTPHFLSFSLKIMILRCLLCRSLLFFCADSPHLSYLQKCCLYKSTVVTCIPNLKMCLLLFEVANKEKSLQHLCDEHYKTKVVVHFLIYETSWLTYIKLPDAYRFLLIALVSAEQRFQQVSPKQRGAFELTDVNQSSEECVIKIKTPGQITISLL